MKRMFLLAVLVGCSGKPPAAEAPRPAPEGRLEEMTFGDAPLPPFPAPQGVLDGLPEQSPPIVIATSKDRLALYADSDNSSTNAYVADVPGTRLPKSLAVLRNYWGDGKAREYTLTLRRYWRQVPEAYTLIPPGGGFTKTFTSTHGVSTADTTTLSAELGVDVEGLSAKLSASFSHEVTITDETQEQTRFTAGAPADGYQRVWVLWQLVEELVALDTAGNVIEPSDGREGDVIWLADDPFGQSASGAYLNYRNVQQAFPTTKFMPRQYDFKDP